MIRSSVSFEAVTNAPAGRRQQAMRNDETILAAAREVFLADPKAPVAAVAERAGVGISALYRRYSSKEELLRTLCHDGLRQFIAEADRADHETDDWLAFSSFMQGIVDADVHSLTVHLAGTFTPTQEMGADAATAAERATALFRRARAGMRAGTSEQDITMLLEMCAAVRIPDAEGTKRLRRRYLALLLDGLRTGGELPGPTPTADMLSWRWRQPR
jgi:AcrR family transcriptional regulator